MLTFVHAKYMYDTVVFRKGTLCDDAIADMWLKCL
jgi:hypothetical protein